MALNARSKEAKHLVHTSQFIFKISNVYPRKSNNYIIIVSVVLLIIIILNIQFHTNVDCNLDLNESIRIKFLLLNSFDCLLLNFRSEEIGPESV